MEKPNPRVSRRAAACCQNSSNYPSTLRAIAASLLVVTGPSRAGGTVSVSGPQPLQCRAARQNKMPPYG